MSRLVVLLNSDNFQNQYVSLRTYQNLRLEMSSGDFGSHKYELVELPLGATFIATHECITVSDDGSEVPDVMVADTVIASDFSADVLIENAWSVVSTEGI